MNINHFEQTYNCKRNTERIIKLLCTIRCIIRMYHMHMQIPIWKNWLCHSTKEKNGTRNIWTDICVLKLVINRSLHSYLSLPVPDHIRPIRARTPVFRTYLQDTRSLHRWVTDYCMHALWCDIQTHRPNCTCSIHPNRSIHRVLWKSISFVVE